MEYISVMDTLPVYVLEKIFSYLDFEGLISATGVNKIWCDVINRKFKHTGVIRYHNQQLNREYSHLWICRPVPKEEFTKYINDRVSFLGIKIDQGTGIEEKWRGSDLRDVLEIILNGSPIKVLNIVDLEIDHQELNLKGLEVEPRFSFPEVQTYFGPADIEMINRSQYEVDGKSMASFLWRNRYNCLETVIVNGTSYFGYFRKGPRYTSVSLLEGMVDVHLEGFNYGDVIFSLLTPHSIQQFSIHVNNDNDHLSFVSRDFFLNFPNMRRLAIISLSYSITLNTIFNTDFKNLKELVLFHFDGRDLRERYLISNHFDKLHEEDFKLNEVLVDDSNSRMDIKINSTNILLLKKMIFTEGNIRERYETIGLHFYYNVGQIRNSLIGHDGDPIIPPYNALHVNTDLILYFHF